MLLNNESKKKTKEKSKKYLQINKNANITQQNLWDMAFIRVHSDKYLLQETRKFLHIQPDFIPQELEKEKETQS